MFSRRNLQVKQKSAHSYLHMPIGNFSTLGLLRVVDLRVVGQFESCRWYLALVTRGRLHKTMIGMTAAF
jgi:hypothetical protein